MTDSYWLAREAFEKSHALAAMLGIHRNTALGMFNMLADWVFFDSPDSDSEVFTGVVVHDSPAIKIAELTEWPGDPEQLINALHDSGFINVLSPRSFVIKCVARDVRIQDGELVADNGPTRKADCGAA